MPVIYTVKLLKRGKKESQLCSKNFFLKKKLIKNISKINLRKRKSGEEVVDWRMSNKFIHNLVRALSKPYVGAYFIYKKRNIC